MKLTDALLGEHGAFYVLFDLIEEIAATQSALAQLLGTTTILESMVYSHARLEEELLFSALEPHLGREDGVLAVMYDEHKEMERMLGYIEKIPDVDQAILWIPEALGAARNHFQKEEQVLFPMAQSVVGDETLSRLGRAWAETRGVTIN
jgi:hemerythrin-like domain-containing protein